MYMHVCHSKDILTTSQSCPAGMSAPSRVTPFNRKVMCNNEHRETESKAHGISKTMRWINHEQDCEKDQFVPSCLQTNRQSGKMHEKASPRTQDKATQTAGFSSLTSQDASVQCCLWKAARMRIFTEPIHHSRTHKAPASRRQARHSSENHGNNQFAQSKIQTGERNKSWKTSERVPTKQGPETMTGHECLSKSESQTCMQKHPLLHCSHANAPGINN